MYPLAAIVPIIFFMVVFSGIHGFGTVGFNCRRRISGLVGILPSGTTLRRLIWTTESIFFIISGSSRWWWWRWWAPDDLFIPGAMTRIFIFIIVVGRRGTASPVQVFFQLKLFEFIRPSLVASSRTRPTLLIIVFFVIS